MFQYNRFNREKLLNCFKNATIKNGSILLPTDYDIELHLIDVPKPEQSDLETHASVIKDALEHLPDFDNIVQKYCEADYKKSNLHIRNFLFSLSYIEVSQNEINLCYWGEEVNSEFTETFTKIDEGWVLQKRIG